MARSDPFGRCRLCGERRPLCKSHIMPESVYRRLYDEKHRAITLRLGSEDPGSTQKGMWEHLLCSDCEKHLNEYDDYFAKVWYAFPKLPEYVTVNPLVVEGLDYKLFRLFHLSVLWRAGMAKRREFHNVSLGKKHSDALRKMLLDDDPGPSSRYPILADLLVTAEKRVHHGLVMNPGFKRIGPAHVYYFWFGACVWMYCVSSHLPAEWKTAQVFADGRLILPWCEFTAHPVWKEFISQQKKMLNDTQRSNGSDDEDP